MEDLQHIYLFESIYLNQAKQESSVLKISNKVFLLFILNSFSIIRYFMEVIQQTNLLVISTNLKRLI